jgi:hypothetical protein
MHQNRGLTDLPLEHLKSSLFVLSPLPYLVLLEEVVEWLCYVWETRDPALIEIYKTDEFTYSTDWSWLLPICYCADLLVIHFKASAANVHSQELNLLLVELALLWVAVKFCVSEQLEGIVDSMDMVYSDQMVV